MYQRTAPAPDRPFFQIIGLELRWWPIALAVGVMVALMVPAGLTARWLFEHHPDWFHHQVWAFGGLAELLHTVAGLVAVVVMRRLLPQAESNLRWPPGRSDVGLALAIGVAMAAVMLVASHAPELVTRTAPKIDYEMTWIGVPGWLTMMLAAGPCEEIAFRGVLVGMLSVLVPGRVRLGRFDIPFSGVVVAVLFSLAHLQSFFTDSLYDAVAQQLYAFAFGLIYVWLMERSRSLLAPMIAHGVGDMLEVAATMLLSVVWG
jgi:membrane protease YdiL (CAAX protease family)